MVQIIKPKRLKDKKAYERARKPYCEVCGKKAYGGPHHIFTRGAGGADHEYNLIQLCFSCHYEKVPSGKLSREKLLGIVAQREDMTVGELEEINYLMKRGERIEY